MNRRSFLAATVLGPFSARSAAAAQRDCTLVELYPGYPGYQGYVTGVDGVGDHACLEDLEDRDLDFSKRREDRLNRRAAERLGIDGDLEDWTWENWLGIEAERGLQQALYSYVLSVPSNRRSQDSEFDRDDPRLLLGNLQSDTLTSWLAKEFHVYGPQIRTSGWTDFDLRVWGSSVLLPRYPNAEQLLDSASDVFELLFRVGRHEGGNLYLNGSAFWDRTVEYGGWFPMHSDAAAEDQVLGIAGCAYALRLVYNETAVSEVQQRLEAAIQDWFANGPRVPLAEWFQDANAANWL